MSGKISGQVWDLDLPHAEAWVLMSMADHAEHDGSNVFPSQPLIAWKTGYSVRQVRRIQDRLKARKILIPEGFGPHGTTLFRIDLSRAPLKPEFSRPDKMSGADKMSVVYKRPITKGRRTRPDKMSGADKMSSEDIYGIRPDIWMSDEPSLETSVKDLSPTPLISDQLMTQFSADDLMALWNELAPPVGLPRKLRLGSLKGKMQTRLREHPEAEWWRAVIEKIVTIPWFLGENDRQWVADLDYLVKNDTNAQRIFERPTAVKPPTKKLELQI